MINFFVPGQPVGKGRARVGKVNGHERMFTPVKTVNYEGLVKHAAHIAMAGRVPLLGPVRCVLDIRLQIPASWSQRKQQRAEAGMEYPTSKPDADNIIKAIYDACNGVVWRDDVQVVSGAQEKRYGRTPGVNVKIEVIA